jgi:hypothetical protein
LNASGLRNEGGHGAFLSSVRYLFLVSVDLFPSSVLSLTQSGSEVVPDKPLTSSPINISYNPRLCSIARIIAWWIS